MSLTTLNDDVAYLQGVEDKDTGSLIKSEDWNNLVTSVEGIGVALLQYIDENNTRVGNLALELPLLASRVDDIEEGLERLTTNIEPLLNQYVVTMSTAKVNYALGELCEITAEVKSLSGEPITSRPWIDFISTWGQMRVAPGFTSATGASGSSISVRANASGIARVLVKSAHTENLTEVQENQVAAAMETTLSTGGFFFQTIMDAPTPASEPVIEAFQIMTLQYDQVQDSPMQLFLDSYQQYPQFQILPQWNPGIFSSWTSYRAIVVAFAKDDSDPTTPDATKGTSSIQVTFRDWVSPWIGTYVNDFGGFVPGIMSTMSGQIGGAGFAVDLDLVHTVIGNNIDTLGILGRQRYYNGFINAVDQLVVNDPPLYFQDLKQTVKHSVTMQQLQESPGVALRGNQASKTPALTAMTGVSRHAAAAKDVAETTLGTFDALEASNKDLSDKIAAMDSDLRATQQTSTEITTHLSSIGQNVLRINTLDQNSVQSQINLITAQLGQIGVTLNRERS